MRVHSIYGVLARGLHWDVSEVEKKMLCSFFFIIIANSEDRN